MKVRCKFAFSVIALMLLASLWSGALWSAVIPGFYQASVPVADRSANVRQQALREALEILVIRVAGDPQVTARAGTAGLLGQPGRFVQQYQYVAAPAESPAEAQLQLAVVFDGRALEQAMRDAALPVWGRQRPELIAWVVVERQGRRQLLAADDPLAQTLTTAARQRGLPLMLPLMDLEDQAVVQTADVWGGFVDPVRRASQRYNAQGILLGRISGGGRYWDSRWVLLFNNERSDWRSQAGSATAVLQTGVDELTTQLGTRLAIRGVDAPPGVQLLAIEGVQGMTDFARISSYLQQLSLVEDVTLRRVSPGRLELYVSLNGGLEYLNQAVALGGQLAVQATQPVPVYRVK